MRLRDRERRERFCTEFVVDLNGHQAALRAGFAAKSARVTASRLLTQDNIVARIAAAQAKRSGRTEISIAKTRSSGGGA